MVTLLSDCSFRRYLFRSLCVRELVTCTRSVAFILLLLYGSAINELLSASALCVVGAVSRTFDKHQAFAGSYRLKVIHSVACHSESL